MFKRFWWIFPICLVVLPILGVVTGGLVAERSSGTYDSTATVQLRHRGPAIPGSDNSTFFDTEAEVLKARETLKPVVDELDLRERWSLSRDEALDRLKGMITTNPIPGTELVEIAVHASDPEFANEVASAVIAAYGKRRTDLERQRSDAALDELRNAVDKQEKIVEEKRQALLGTTNNRSSGAKRRDDIEAHLEDLRKHLETLLKLEGEPLYDYAADIEIPANSVQPLHEQYLEAVEELDTLKNSLGAAHPKRMQQQGVVDDLLIQLDEAVADLKSRLRDQLELARDQRGRTGPDEPQAHEENPFGLTRPLHFEHETAEFDDRRAEYDGARSLLERLEVKLISEEMERKITDSPVTIHEQPNAGESSRAPSFVLHLLTGLGIGLLLGILTPFLLIPLLHGIFKPSTA